MGREVSMEINVLIDDDFEGMLEAGWLEGIAEHVLIAQNVGSAVELGLVITSQERVWQLNRSYRGKDEPTDVLAFSITEEKGADSSPFIAPPDGVLHLGEVIIAYPQAVKQAEEHQHSVKKEIATLVIHGVLHLLGYDDEEPELRRQMLDRGEEILSSIEIEAG